MDIVICNCKMFCFIHIPSKHEILLKKNDVRAFGRVSNILIDRTMLNITRSIIYVLVSVLKNYILILRSLCIPTNVSMF